MDGNGMWQTLLGPLQGPKQDYWRSSQGQSVQQRPCEPTLSRSAPGSARRGSQRSGAARVRGRRRGMQP